MQQNSDPGGQVAAQYGLHRSSKWPAVQKKHIQIEPACVACGSSANLNVHHILPFHFCILLGRPELELDQRNLVTLCEGTTNHHLLLGHLDNWQSYHKNVKTDAPGPFKGMTDAVIRANQLWQEVMKNRPPVWEKMNDADKAAFRLLMDTMYPPVTMGTQGGNTSA